MASGPAPPHGAPAGPVVSLRPLGIGEMLDAGLKLFRTQPRDMVLASFVLTVPAVALLVLVQLSAGNPDALTRTDEVTGQPVPDGRALLVFLGATLVSTAILLAVTNLAVAGTMRMSISAYLGTPVGWRESLRYAFSRLGSLTFLLILTTAGMVGGLLLCIVPGLWLQGVWGVAVPAMLVEELGAVGSLKRSFTLVRGRFWPVFGALFLAGLLASVVSSLLAAPALVVQFAGGSFVVSSILSGLGQVVGSALTIPYTAAVTAVVYFDLRVRKEGYDLELLAQRVGVAPSPEARAAAHAVRPAAPIGPPQPVPPPGGWGRPAG